MIRYLQKGDLTEKELKDAFQSLKTNKTAGYDDISANIIKKSYEFINQPLHYIFNLSIKKETFQIS